MLKKVVFTIEEHKLVERILHQELKRNVHSSDDLVIIHMAIGALDKAKTLKQKRD
jgi:hypothetical protein